MTKNACHYIAAFGLLGLISVATISSAQAAPPPWAGGPHAPWRAWHPGPPVLPFGYVVVAPPAPPPPPPVYYAPPPPPPVYYAPPPVYYAPPALSFGITLPIH
jgi:hypothetical protein